MALLERSPTHRLGLQLAGMTCDSCVARVEKTLTAVPGVRQASVNLARWRPAFDGKDPANSGPVVTTRPVNA